VLARLFLSTFFLFLLTAASLAQSPGQRQPPTPPRTDITPPLTSEDEATSRMTSEMARKAAKERIAELKTDTDKLLKLSVELKQSVDKSNENVLSVDVIKKAEEIEKLAHSVREKMKGPN
jgi:5'-deoxynucleotidase YfbR-like HD superfamily hydrolase